MPSSPTRPPQTKNPTSIQALAAECRADRDKSCVADGLGVAGGGLSVRAGVAGRELDGVAGEALGRLAVGVGRPGVVDGAGPSHPIEAHESKAATTSENAARRGSRLGNRPPFAANWSDFLALVVRIDLAFLGLSRAVSRSD